VVFPLFIWKIPSPFAILYPINSFVRQSLASPRALSFGAALFLVAVVIGGKTLINKDITPGNSGILGGPVALAALQAGAGQTPVDVALGTSDPAAMTPRDSSGTSNLDLSTGSLDGTQPFQAILALNTEKDPSLLEKNEKAIKAVAALASADPEAKKAPVRYFVQPASGKNWGVLHTHNAVDIANSCGTPVVAAAAGTIVSDSNLGSGASGWNGGFGKFLLIKHPNGTKTRYAHLSKIYVTVGEEVEQGEEIAEIGNTGHVDGVTGCHVHFEVIGGANPFVRG
jgi:murein DD-endopeptidase MepM/ murein hydrolase activator NlpD